MIKAESPPPSVYLAILRHVYLAAAKKGVSLMARLGEEYEEPYQGSVFLHASTSHSLGHPSPVSFVTEDDSSAMNSAKFSDLEFLMS